VCLLTPTNDPLLNDYGNRRDIDIIEGSEDDVLSRYSKAMHEFLPDYMVRLTSDCPLLSPRIISQHIISADKYKYDYVSNTNPKVRMHPDGWDCEVMNKKMMDWLKDNVTTSHDKEHVTTLVRSRPPKWANIGDVLGELYLKDLKLSVDTQEDLEFVRTYQKLCRDNIGTAKARKTGNGYHIT